MQQVISTVTVSSALLYPIRASYFFPSSVKDCRLFSTLPIFSVLSVLIPPQKKKKKTLCFKTLVSSLESGYEYFWVFGFFFFGGVQRLKEKWRSFQWKSQYPGKGDNNGPKKFVGTG